MFAYFFNCKFFCFPLRCMKSNLMSNRIGLFCWNSSCQRKNRIFQASHKSNRDDLQAHQSKLIQLWLYWTLQFQSFCITDYRNTVNMSFAAPRGSDKSVVWYGRAFFHAILDPGYRSSLLLCHHFLTLCDFLSSVEHQKTRFWEML